MRVCIDSGHCKLTPGKRAFDGSFYEWEFNLDVSNKIKDILTRHGVNSYVQYVENSNPTTELNTRIANINKDKPTLVVSIHANAYGTNWNNANGWEIYCYKPNTTSNSFKLAQHIQESSKELGLFNRGIKDASNVSGIVMNTSSDAVLIEHGFYTNTEELKKLKSQSFRQKCAECDAKGILKYLGIAYNGNKEGAKMDFEQALEFLRQKGVVNSPDYWKNASGVVYYLKDLIIDVAQKWSDEK